MLTRATMLGYELPRSYQTFDWLSAPIHLYCGVVHTPHGNPCDQSFGIFCCGRAPPLAAPREVPTKRGTRSGSRHTRSAVSLEPDVLGGNAVVAAAPPNRTAHCHLSITTLPDTHYKSRKTPKEKGYPKKKSICSGSREKNGNRISEYHKKQSARHHQQW